MTLLVNILFFVSSYLPNNGITSLADKYFISNLSTIQVLFDSPADNTTENNNSSFNQEQKNQISYKTFCSSDFKKMISQNIPTNFLFRLLPFMIDEPPPCNLLLKLFFYK